MSEEDEIKKFILRKLIRRRYWQHKHTSIHNLSKGMSDRLRQSKHLKKAVTNMLKENILLSKPTHYGLEISLNIKKKKEIEEFVRRN